MHDDRLFALIELDRARLVRAAARLLGPADAEDAVQDACVRALESDALTLDVAQAWLSTVVRNLAIDRLRRRRWMQQWLLEAAVGEAMQASPPADREAASVEEAALALRLLAAALTPADGATVLLHEVFEVGHAEIAQASGRTEAGSRQALRRSLSKLRPAAGQRPSTPELDQREETVFRLYLNALQRRDPQILWAMLRQPPVSASLAMPPVNADPAPAKPATACSVVQLSGRIGLVLTLDGVTLCVLPLGVKAEVELA